MTEPMIDEGMAALHRDVSVAEGESLLETHDLTVKFGGLTALDAVSFAIKRGEILGLIGPNGAGKTTCFNAITGVYKPSSGSVTFDGAPLGRIKRHQITRRVKGSKLDEAQVLRHARDLVKNLLEHELVVHMDHGIAKFTGIELRDGKEVMVLKFAEDARLYVPLQQAHLVSRYVGVGGKAPALVCDAQARDEQGRSRAVNPHFLDPG